jgi:hypothetical protein
MLTRSSICINLLKDIASDSKLGYIGFYTNLLKRVKIDKNKRLGKGSFKLKGVIFRLFSILIKRFIRLYAICEYL